MDQMDIKTFTHCLSETIAWCGSRASLTNHKQPLRAISLNVETDLSGMKAEQLRQIADHIFQERARLLRAENIEVSKADLAGGRLLICYPEESVWDGASETASQGFFDDSDIPAWDTWCAYGIEERPEPAFFIVSWVPPAFIKLAQGGIEVNPVECIQWASKPDNMFTRLLKTEGTFL
jgi:hypothetical protein